MTSIPLKRDAFPLPFYLANTMEVFERIAWYGFFTVSSLYMTSSPASGGLGLTDGERGVLQGIIPFFIYVLPVFTGALGDRLGYRRMFFAAFVILAPSYYLLGQANSFWPFFAVYLLVALGAAIFKPLVVATVARSASDSNRGLAFGIFYMMVNIGGFIGPIIAGYARAISWDLVFVIAACAIAVNFAVLPFLPRDDVKADAKAGVGALADVQKVLGNGRFALLVAPILIALLAAGGGWLSYQGFSLFVVGWIVFHFLWDRIATTRPDAPWHRQKLRIGNGPFLVYLLVLSLFWAAYNQIFLSFPLYLRDFVDTGDLVLLASAFGDGFVSFISPVNINELARALPDIAANAAAMDEPALATAGRAIVEYQVRPPMDAIGAGLAQVSADPAAARTIAEEWTRSYRQVSPEYIVAFDFLSIVLFQYLVSRFAQGRAPFAILVAGSVLIGVAYLIGGIAHAAPFAGMAAVGAVVVFAFGEMLASPKSQEFVATLAPREQAAMFMGYYFVSLALGFLFAGLLSGWAYELFAEKLQQPMTMWAMFAGLAFVAAFALILFNRHFGQRMRAAAAAVRPA